MVSKIKVIEGDITQLKVDAIVNAANTDLSKGAGVCGAIHAASGPELEKACQALGECITGQAKITPGFQLPARFVIHAVGPIWRGGSKGEPQLLASCYNAALHLALKEGLHSIAFPAISCGIYGYPLSQAATIAVNEVANFIQLHPEIETLYFVCYDKSVFDAYNQALGERHDDE
jgi:O-acetyl-ADP-ribose deacetylase (regulator of RNase III)